MLLANVLQKIAREHDVDATILDNTSVLVFETRYDDCGAWQGEPRIIQTVKEMKNFIGR